MKEIKVLGSGCTKCVITAKLIEEVAEEKGIEVRLDKITEMAEIVSYGVMSTPAVVVDGKVVHSGSVPDRVRVGSWLR
jgi:small redox-active disulfide protein 2